MEKNLFQTQSELIEMEKRRVSYGYKRISDKVQVTDRQHKAIMEYRSIPDCNMFEDVWTGKTAERPNYQKMKSIIEYQLQVIDENTTIEV